MSRSDEYREIAKECIASARMSRSKQQRKQLLELAKTWMTAASLLERRGNSCWESPSRDALK